MNYEKLIEAYKTLSPEVKKIYVVPLINFKMKHSDYLYLFYQNFLERNNSSSIEIESLSALAHPKLFLSRFKKEKNLLHYHWFEVHDFKSFLGMTWKIFWITAFKITGGKIVWTVHNKFPHSNNYKAINKISRKYLAKLANKIHVHCKEAVEIMLPIFNVKREKFIIIENPYYPAAIIQKDDAQRLLQEKYPILKIDNRKTFLMFGAIADYKGLKEAVKLFKNFRDKTLIIAGGVKKWDEYYYRELLEEVKGSSNIFIIGRSIPDEDLPLYYNSADYILFNYKDILTSGGVMMALSYKKKTIAPSMGCLKDIEDKNLILFYKDPVNDLKNILEKVK